MTCFRVSDIIILHFVLLNFPRYIVSNIDIKPRILIKHKINSNWL